MRTIFEVHRLNDAGMVKAKKIAQSFEYLLDIVDITVMLQSERADGGRELAIVRTKLEEACFYAKKAMALQKENQDPQ